MNTFERDQKAVWLNVFQMILDTAHPQRTKIGLEYRASFEELYESARKTLAAFKELPPDAPVPEEVISHWVALVGEVEAERRGSAFIRRADALRYLAYKSGEVPLKKAMALTEEELVPMFFESLTLSGEFREFQAERRREHLNVVAG